MKRVTVPFLKKTIVLLIGVLLALTVVSCEYININIQDLVVEKLDNAVIERIDFAYGTNENKYGQDCIFSNYYGGYRLDGTIRNPRGYNLIVRYEMTDGTTVTQATYNSESEYRDALINSEPPTAVSFVMDGNSGFSMYLSNTFLRTRELNLSKRNIGGTLTLKDIAGGREFDPYSFALRVNSAPEGPFGTMLQRNGAGTEYILCFNMPTSLLTAEVMFDTHVIDINGMKRYFKSCEDFDGHFYTDAAMTNVDPSFTMERPEDLRPLKDDGDLFEESDWAVSVYYYTRVAETREDKTWTLFIEDDEGLKSDTDYACNNEKTLSNPWFDIATDARVDVNDDGIYIMKVYHNGKCLDGADVGDYLYIHYTLIDQNGEIETGSSACWDRGDGMYAEIELNINIYREITVWAKAQHHTPSDRISVYNVTVKRPPELYVSNSGYDWNTGAKNNPLRTIYQAIENFLDGDAEEYRNETTFKIYLLDDITPGAIVEGDFITIPEAKTSSGTVKTFNIIGYDGNRTIYGWKYSDAPGSVVHVNGNAHATFTNITLTGGNTANESNGGGIYVEDGAVVTLTNCTITGNRANGGNGGGIYNEGGSITLNNCSITNNTASNGGGGIFNNGGSVTINSGTITGNTAGYGGGGVYAATDAGGEFRIKGAVTITGNTSTTDGVNNVYLEDGKVIAIDGTLGSGSQIGVKLQTVPTPPTETTPAVPVVFTSGLSNGASSVFTSDNNEYVVIPYNGQVALSVSGGSYSGGTMPTSNLNYAFMDAASGGNAVTRFYAGSAKNIYVRTNVPGESSPIPPSNITYTFTLKTGNKTVATPSGTIVGDTVKITIPADLFPDNYTLYVTATYNGITYNYSHPLEALEHGDFSAPAPNGFVAVTGATVSGAVGSGDAASSVFITGRTIEIPDLYVSDHEVTRTEYAAVMGTESGEGTVNKVSWFDALKYCNKKSIADGLTPCYAVDGKTNPDEWSYAQPSSNFTGDHSDFIVGVITCNFDADGYRLPTEAEWEYTARGNDFMNASLNEWCWDYSANSTPTNNTPATGFLWDSSDNTGRYPVLRNGVSSSIRHWDPAYMSIYAGFRVVCTAR